MTSTAGLNLNEHKNIESKGSGDNQDFKQDEVKNQPADSNRLSNDLQKYGLRPGQEKGLISLYQKFMQKSEQLIDPESSQSNLDDESSQPEYNPEAYYTSHEKTQQDQQQVVQNSFERSIRSPKQIDIKLDELFASNGQATSKPSPKNYFVQQPNEGMSSEKLTRANDPNFRKQQNDTAKQSKDVTSDQAKNKPKTQKKPFKPETNSKNTTKITKPVESQKPSQRELITNGNNRKEERNVENLSPRNPKEGSLDDHMQKLQAAEEEILSSYFELDQRQKESSKRLSLIKTEFSSNSVQLSTSSSPVFAENINKGALSSKIISDKEGIQTDPSLQNSKIQPRSTPKESGQLTNQNGSHKIKGKQSSSLLAKSYLQSSRVRAQSKELNISLPTKPCSNQGAPHEDAELRELNEKPAPVEREQIKMPKKNGAEKHGEKKEASKSIKPLTLQDFRMAATSKSGNKSVRNSDNKQGTQDISIIQAKNNQTTSPSNYKWESLINSAKIREEKVFAMTPSQEYLILDKEQLVDNPNLKVLNSKSWSEFFGIIADEEDQDELNILSKQKLNYTVADDTVYRKNMEWLAEKKKFLQEKKESLYQQSLEECTFQPHFETKSSDRLLRSTQLAKPSTSKHNSAIRNNNHQVLKSSRTERPDSRSASRDSKGFISYSELHKHRKDILTETQNKLSLSGTYEQGLLKTKNT